MKTRERQCRKAGEWSGAHWEGAGRNKRTFPSCQGANLHPFGPDPSRRDSLSSEARFIIVGELEKAVAAAETEFVAQVLTVRLHRAHGAADRVGDLLARPVVGDELENSEFRRGALPEARLLLPQPRGGRD